MGFSTFGSKPHLAKKRKLEDPPNAEEMGSDSLSIGSKRGERAGADVITGAHLSQVGGDGDGGTMGVDEEDAYGVEDRSVEDEDVRKEVGSEDMGSHTRYGAQVLSLVSGRSSRPPEREVSPAEPATIPAIRAAAYDTVDSSNNTTPALTTNKMTTTTGSESGYNFLALRHGVRDENGDVAYYDHSFVEDPWKGLR